MNAPQWLALANALLQKHFYIGINDVGFDTAYAEKCLQAGSRPFQEVNFVAEKYDLNRADPHAYGVELTLDDELAVTPRLDSRAA